MKRKGCSILFLNCKNQILLFLRDNIPEIPYPNMWDVLGGHVDPDETPEECIVREMQEEIGMDLEEFNLFSEVEFADRIEYTYWKKADLNINEINLMEGQKLKWFTREEVRETPLAYGFNTIVENFYHRLRR